MLARSSNLAQFFVASASLHRPHSLHPRPTNGAQNPRILVAANSTGRGYNLRRQENFTWKAAPSRSPRFPPASSACVLSFTSYWLGDDLNFFTCRASLFEAGFIHSQHPAAVCLQIFLNGDRNDFQANLCQWNAAGGRVRHSPLRPKSYAQYPRRQPTAQLRSSTASTVLTRASLRAPGQQADRRVAYIVDLDDNIRARFATDAETPLGHAPKAERAQRALESKDVRRHSSIATPESTWHTPLAVLSSRQEGVYVESCPAGNGPRRRLVAVQKEICKMLGGLHSAAFLAALLSK